MKALKRSDKVVFKETLDGDVIASIIVPQAQRTFFDEKDFGGDFSFVEQRRFSGKFFLSCKILELLFSESQSFKLIHQSVLSKKSI